MGSLTSFIIPLVYLLIGYFLIGLFQFRISDIFYYIGMGIGVLKNVFYSVGTMLGFSIPAFVWVVYGSVIFILLFAFIKKTLVASK